jgi:hypothetical protein
MRQTSFSIFLMLVEIDRQTEKETDLVLHLPDASRDHDLPEKIQTDRGREERQIWISIFLMLVERERETEDETDLVLHLPDASRDHDLLEDGPLDAEHLPLLYSLMDKHHI